MNNKSFDYDLAFSRNIGLYTVAEQKLLRTKKVAIPGCGGVGGIHAQTLARTGIGHFVIADFDAYAVENFNRQWGARMSTIDAKKVDCIKREILEINPEATVEVYSEGVTEENIDLFLSGVDVVADALDFFAFDARKMLFQKCYEKDIPLVTGAPIGFSCALLVLTGRGMHYKDYFNFKDNDSASMTALKLIMGLTPKPTQFSYMDTGKVDLNKGAGPSAAIAVTQCTSMVVAHVVKLMLGRGVVKPLPYFAQYDVYRNKYRTGRLFFGNRGPIQRLKIWYVQNFVLSNKEQ